MVLNSVHVLIQTTIKHKCNLLFIQQKKYRHFSSLSFGNSPILIFVYFRQFHPLKGMITILVLILLR